MTIGLVTTLALALVFLIVLLKSVVLVQPAQVAVVERLGRFSHALEPGLHLIVPIIDHVKHRVSMAEQFVELHDEPLVAGDDYLVHADVRVALMVEDPARATYEVDDPLVAVRDALRTHLRERVATMDSADAIERGATRIHDARVHLEPLARQWGVRVVSVDGAITRPTG